jgi:hypothetical protein
VRSLSIRKLTCFISDALCQYTQMLSTPSQTHLAVLVPQSYFECCRYSSVLHTLVSWVFKFISGTTNNWEDTVVVICQCWLQCLLSHSNGKMNLAVLISFCQGLRSTMTKLIAVPRHSRLWDETQPRVLGPRVSVQISLPYVFSGINTSPEVPYDPFHLDFYSFRRTGAWSWFERVRISSLLR